MLKFLATLILGFNAILCIGFLIVFALVTWMLFKKKK